MDRSKLAAALHTLSSTLELGILFETQKCSPRLDNVCTRTVILTVRVNISPGRNCLPVRGASQGQEHYGGCGWQSNGPKDVHILVPGTRGSAQSRGKGELRQL